MEVGRRKFLFGLVGAAAFPAIVRIESLMRGHSIDFSQAKILAPKTWEVFDKEKRLVLQVAEADILKEADRYYPVLGMPKDYLIRGTRVSGLPLVPGSGRIVFASQPRRLL